MVPREVSTAWLPLLLLLQPFNWGSGQAQREDQTYILIQPRILELSEDEPEGVVQVVCRQIPLSLSKSGHQLLLRRRPLQKSLASYFREEILAILGTGAHNISVNAPRIVASGDVNHQLVVTMNAVTCRDAQYSYVCQAGLSDGSVNTASTTFIITTPPPNFSLLAKPYKRKYERDDEVSLTCSSGNDAVGVLALGTGSLQGVQITHWKWEFTELGDWKPANPKDIRGGGVSTSGTCFQKAFPSVLQVHLLDFETCSRRFRCYLQRGNENSDVDSAEELMLSMGYDCQEGDKVLGTDPVVAIIGVLGAVAFFCLLAYGLFLLSRAKRQKQKERKAKQVEMRILSPMTPEQRDRLLKERMKNQVEEGATSQVVSSESRTDLNKMSDFEMEDEDEEEESMDELSSSKAKKPNVTVVVEETPSMESESTTAFTTGSED